MKEERERETEDFFRTNFPNTRHRVWRDPPKPDFGDGDRVLRLHTLLSFFASRTTTVATELGGAFCIPVALDSTRSGSVLYKNYKGFGKGL